MCNKLVYKEFNKDIHIILDDDLEIDPIWPKFRSIAFGFAYPFVCLYIAVDPNDNIIIFDEYYQAGKSVEEHAKALVEKHPGNFNYTTCDPSGSTERAMLLENGIPTLAVRSFNLHGIEAVRDRLKIQVDGKPRFYISSRCTETIKEFLSYGEVKLSYPHDHTMNAIRYFIVNWQRKYTRYLKK